MQFEDYLHFHELWIFALQSNYENSFHWFFYNLHNLDFECVQKLTRRREFLEFSLSIISTQLRCDASDVKILSSHCDNPNNSKVCLVSSPISHLYKKLTHFKTLLQFLKFRQNGKSWYFKWFLRKKVFDLHYYHNAEKLAEMSQLTFAQKMGILDLALAWKFTRVLNFSAENCSKMCFKKIWFLNGIWTFTSK